MMDIAVAAYGLSKRYRLGDTHTNLLSERIGQMFRRRRRVGRDEFWALRDVSFEAAHGDVVGIIGRNGAGKSTLLKVLSRLTAPTTGRALVRGRLASLLEVGTGFHPELTGRENIFLNGTILGMRRRDIVRQFDSIVAFSGVESFIDTPVKRYSSGMYVRLAFAVAAHVDSEILVIDEVLAVGDAEFQKRCLGKMHDVARSGRTVLFVSHNLVAVRHLCNRGLVLERGKLVRSGSAEECVTYYETQHGAARTSTWMDTRAGNRAALAITRVSSHFTARTPQMVLTFEIDLESHGEHKPAFIAIDILDAVGTPVMQALPRIDGFLRPSPQRHRVRVDIDMPPMIPGDYLATIWVGSHNSETLDTVEEVVAFEIVDSPTPGRTFPHTKDHGFIVPRSRVVEVEP